VQAIIGTRLFPGVLDRLLGRTAVDGQHTDEPLPAHRPDNLYEPVAGDHGAHGRFDSQAHAFSAQWWANKHRVLLVAAASVIWMLGRSRVRRIAADRR
jgi:hypothetical protein